MIARFIPAKDASFETSAHIRDAASALLCMNGNGTSRKTAIADPQAHWLNLTTDNQLPDELLNTALRVLCFERYAKIHAELR